MDQKSEFNEKLPDQETIEDGRKGSLYIGLAIGAGTSSLASSSTRSLASTSPSRRPRASLFG